VIAIRSSIGEGKANVNNRLGVGLPSDPLCLTYDETSRKFRKGQWCPSAARAAAVAPPAELIHYPSPRCIARVPRLY